MSELLLSIALVAGLAAEAGRYAPHGYRYPKETDVVGEWRRHRQEFPTPFLVRADFDGDGIEDEAWLLIEESGKGWGLFVALHQRVGRPHWQRLAEGAGPVQESGISLVGPGMIKTLCGKGAWECGFDEPAELKLDLPAFELMAWEKASSLFWWDPRAASFRQVALSD